MKTKTLLIFSYKLLHSFLLPIIGGQRFEDSAGFNKDGEEIFWEEG